MTDLAAIKARLNDPREVAAMLGLRVLARQARGVITACPVHGNKSGSLSIRIGRDGTLQAVCRGCNFGPGGKGGDVLTLLEAIEGDFKRGLARAAELAGGAVGAPVAAWEAPERLDPDVYHELATRILDAGKLDGRPWTRDVAEYLWSRRLLDQAQGDGWAALPSLRWLRSMVPAETLIKAKLAQWNRHGELVPYFGRWQLVIPWRGPDGRINALQRRRTWEFVPRDDKDPEPPKYVLPWAPEWPYGSERLRENDRLSVGDSHRQTGEHAAFAHSAVVSRDRSLAQNGASVPPLHVSAKGNGNGIAHRSADVRHAIAIVEGAVDTLALRSLYPRMLVVGIPGISGWRSSWAPLFEGRTVRYALDRGKMNARGIIEEDRAAARIALDIAGRHEEDPNAEACSLCGGKEIWLCGFCGRRRSTAKDWGEQWAGR